MVKPTEVSIANAGWASCVEDVSASSSRKIKLVDEETRLKFTIDSITVIGNEDFKGPDGKTTTSYKIGIGLTSNRPQRYEDNGEETGRYVNFFMPMTLSFDPKSNIIKCGLADAVGHDLSKVKLVDVIGSFVGKQVSGMILHRKYKTQDGQDRVAMAVEKFKPVQEEDDFSEALSKWEPSYMAQKKYADKRVITLANIRNNTAPQSVSAYILSGGEKPEIRETIKLS